MVLAFLLKRSSSLNFIAGNGHVAQLSAFSFHEPFWVSLLPRGQIIFRMQYSERMPCGPTSLRFMISVVVMSVSVVSV